MKIGDCINVYWSNHKHGGTFTWQDDFPDRVYADRVAMNVELAYREIRRLGVWRVKELKA